MCPVIRTGLLQPTLQVRWSEDQTLQVSGSSEWDESPCFMPCSQPRWASRRLSRGIRGPSRSAHISSAKFQPLLIGLEKQLQGKCLLGEMLDGQWRQAAQEIPCRSVVVALCSFLQEGGSSLCCKSFGWHRVWAQDFCLTHEEDRLPSRAHRSSMVIVNTAMIPVKGYLTEGVSTFPGL